jgi:uncharacterized protein (TIGR01655 family)
MKKGIIISSIVTLLLLIGFGSAYYWYNINYGTEDYYTQITTNGTKRIDHDDQGKRHVSYDYHQAIYNQKGEAITTEFNSVMARPLKRNAYLKVGYNPKRHRVINWEKVNRHDVPKKALQQLN